jgi:hypothetical protein
MGDGEFVELRRLPVTSVPVYAHPEIPHDLTLVSVNAMLARIFRKLNTETIERVVLRPGEKDAERIHVVDVYVIPKKGFGVTIGIFLGEDNQFVLPQR